MAGGIGYWGNNQLPYTRFHVKFVSLGGFFYCGIKPQDGYMMEPDLKSLRKSINKVFLKEVVDRASFDRFKTALVQLLENIYSALKKDEHEEHFKNFLEPFFKEAGFGGYYINTSGHIDLAVHTGPKVKDPVGVLIEVKRPSNTAEMITPEQLSRKAMHEAVLYYLEQRLEKENTDLKHVVITNMREWFVFDAREIERCFYRPSALRKAYKSWKADRKVSSNKDFMYREIARFMQEQASTLHGTHFSLHEAARLLKAKEGSEHEKKLIPLFKFFTPVHLLKEPFANDSNRLNREFYRELLYILGLEETKEGSARYIRRTEKENRRPGSLIENTLRILDSEDHLSTVSEPEVSYGAERSDQLFNIAMELCIT